MDEMITPSGSLPAHAERVAFSGQNGDFRRLVTFGALLEIVTFGFYRFWLTTNMRRHLWAHTSVAGDTFEYTGRGRELLIGFLLALAILGPFYAAYFWLGIEAERAQAFLSLPLFLVVYGFFQFAIYRARRYRLTRTIWRGVRFWMTGSGVAYAFKAFGWEILQSITLGLAYPWKIAALERYKMGHTYYGNLHGAFVGNGWTFFKRGWWIWLLFWTPVVVFAVAMTVAVGMNPGMAGKLSPAGSGLVFLASLSFLLYPFLFAIFKATEWKWWAESLRFGEVSFGSNLKRGAFIGTYWKMFGVSILVSLIGFTLITLLAVAGFFIFQAFHVDLKVVIIQMQAGALPLPGIIMIAAYIISYLLLVQAMGVVTRIYLFQRVWKIVVSSIVVDHLDGAAHVMAEGEAASALGEGLADGLDFAGF